MHYQEAESSGGSASRSKWPALPAAQMGPAQAVQAIWGWGGVAGRWWECQGRGGVARSGVSPHGDGSPSLPGVCAPFRSHSERPPFSASSLPAPSFLLCSASQGRRPGPDGRTRGSEANVALLCGPRVAGLGVGSGSLCLCPGSPLGTQQVARDTSLLRASAPAPPAPVSCAPPA